jgi:iron(III) transport system permease protein
MIRGLDSVSMANLVKAVIGSLGAAVPAAFLSTSLMLPLVYLGVRRPSALSRLLERLAYIGYAIPPLAFGLSLIFFVQRAIPGLYQTLWLLVYGYTLHFMAEAIGPVRSTIYQASTNIEEAARSLGFSRLKAFFKVTFPILIKGLTVSTAFVFLSAMKDLPIAFLLRPIGYETLALNVWSNTSEAFFAEAAPYALLMIIFAGLFVGLLLVRERSVHELPA